MNEIARNPELVIGTVLDYLPDRFDDYASDLLQALLDSMPGNVAVLDECGNIVGINQNWANFAKSNGLKHPKHGFGQNYLEVCQKAAMHGDTYAMHAFSGIRNVARNVAPSFEMEYPCHRPDELRWFLMNVTRLMWKGPARYIVSHLDITGRKLAELKLIEQMQEMHEFYSVLAHELRNPLASINAAASLILHGKCENQSEARQLLEIISAECNRLITYSSNLLTKDKIDMSAYHINKQLVSADEVVRAVRDSMTGLAMMLCVNLEVSCDPGLKLNCDKQAMSQVLINLVSNALKFSPTNGTVYVSARKCGDRVQFMVKDSGPGMSKEMQSRLFTKYGASSNNKHNLPGTGLGLYIAAQLVDKHEGCISVDSVERSGTIFTVELPM